MKTDRYFLYLDILGFTELVRQKNGEVIVDLYEVIASLNANDHDAFRVVVFSDTVVVYNVNGGDAPEDASYLVMFLCEFVKDLLHRLTGRGIHFRAIITHGDFTHFELNGIPCFFGNALVDAHNAEKEIKAIGLFIDNRIVGHCDIFRSRQFNRNYSFVYVTQSLKDPDFMGSEGFPIAADTIENTESEWQIYPEMFHLASMLAGAQNSAQPDAVREKYQASWELYRLEYPNLTQQLLASNNDIRSISPHVDWQSVADQFPANYSDAIKSRVEF